MTFKGKRVLREKASSIIEEREASKQNFKSTHHEDEYDANSVEYFFLDVQVRTELRIFSVFFEAIRSEDVSTFPAVRSLVAGAFNTH